MGNSIEAVIIDDETDICILLSGMLRKLGLQVSFATTLSEGMKKLKNASDMILFLDNNLPDGSGLEFLIRIRKNFPELKVIMISAYDGDTERKFASENGAVNFIGKPLTRAAILTAMTEIFPDLLNEN